MEVAKGIGVAVIYKKKKEEKRKKLCWIRRNWSKFRFSVR